MRARLTGWRLRSGLLAAVVIAGVVSATAGADTAAEPYRPAAGPVFGKPNDLGWAVNKPRTLILKAISNAPAGSVIRGQTWNYDDAGYTEELLEADSKGVKVLVIMAQGACRSEAAEKLIDDLSARSRVRCAKFSARGKSKFGEHWTTHHQKSWLFSRIGSKTKVTIVTSANATMTAAKDHYTDAYQATDFPQLYDTLRKTFDEAMLDKPLANPFRHVAFSKASSVTISPWNSPTQADPVHERIKGIPAAGARIRIAAGAMFGPRGERLARLLVKKRESGAQIKFLYGEFDDPSAARVRDILRNGGIPIRGAYVSGDYTSHLKFMTASFVSGGKRITRIWTGSENWSNKTRGNDEAVLKLGSAATHTKYAEFFDDIWDRHS
jgi:hypothetical protein